MMQGVVAVTLCWALVSLFATEAVGNTEECKDFNSLKMKPGDSLTYMCPDTECSTGKVYGTNLYFGTSDICLAALHAGVITTLGNTITITCQEAKSVLGTAKNRIVSKDKEKSSTFKAYTVESTGEVDGVVGEVLMVHNSASDGVLRFACLSQDNMSAIASSNLKSWNYKNIIYELVSDVNSPRMNFNMPLKENPHAIRILGSRRDEDVLAVVQYPEAQYQSRVATVRVSVGETVPIHLQKFEAYEDYHFRHLPGNWMSERINNLSQILTPAFLGYTGIYIVHHYNGATGNKKGAYFDLMVRECKAGFFGIGCSKRCPWCQNGGQCHTRRGSCLCPPGFVGDTCQIACLPGWFGNKCQFRCDTNTVGFTGKENVAGSCVGLTICQPSPYGCSCAAGFANPWTMLGPACTQECPKGKFGADCSQVCLGCINDECDSFSGTCKQGCKRSTDCRKGPASPHVITTIRQQSYTLSWDASDSGAHYFFSHQLVQQLSCTSVSTKTPQLHRDTFVAPPYEYTMSNLLPHTSYNVCIVTSSSEGISSPLCSIVNTLSEVPHVNITHLQCIERENLECSADVSGGCENYNGPNINITFILNTTLPCSHSHPLTALQASVELNSSRVRVKFPKYLAGVEYKVRAQVGNIAGTGHKLDITYRIAEKKAPPVQNFTHTILSDSALQLLWNNPCPSNGNIKYIYVNNYGHVPLNPCATTNLFDQCKNITGLQLGEKYVFQIQIRNGAGWSSKSFKVLFEKEPSLPKAINFTSGLRHLNLSLVLPYDHGGILKNCTIFLTHSNKSCSDEVEKKTSSINCTIDDLEEGKKDVAKGRCCNTRFCSKEFQQLVATKPIPPQLNGSLSIVRKTESTITLHLPTINHNRDGINSLIVIVHLEGQTKTPNLTSMIQMQLEESRHLIREKRNAIQMEDQCQKQEWVAAELRQDQEEFVLGDGKMYNGFLNCPLEPGQAYTIGTMAVNDLLGMRSYSELMMKSGLVVVDSSSSNLLLLLLLLLLLMVVLPVLGLLAYFRLRRHPIKEDWMLKFKTGVSQEVLAQPCESSIASNNQELNAEIVTDNVPDHIKEYEEFNEDIYENLKPKGSATITTSHVPLVEVEAYLNKVIGSKEAGDDFRTIPSTLLSKSMAMAQHPENKAKNRYKNNLPYDDTRVVLTCVNEGSTSDYINANHVEGYGNMRYIAAQGPKDVKVSTIGDFWRMVVEQNITVIIMVANFVENGKKKVGQYFSPAQTLNFGVFEVTVNSTEELSHFTLSHLLVKQGKKTSQVQHYHYTKWPDHGIPTEAKSIAQMLKHFQSHHQQGGTVVHCSAGIGRTGTVLQVLLMTEMLTLKEYLNPIEVLGRLRMSRARLVENEPQYNLSLEILEEILFGNDTLLSSDDILNHLDKYASVSRVQYARAKALPSSLSFTTSDLPDYQHLNRNQSVLPADSNRCYLQPRAGVDAWLSQYINAIRVPGSNRGEFMLATEHPLPHTISRFWKLVIETGCTIVIFVNSFEDQDESEYPTMIMKPGEIWNVDHYELEVKETVPYGTWLMHSSLTITSNEDWIHSVVVYQSMKWPVSSPIPPSPYLLLTLAELMQIPRTQTSGPPLLCCSDGVTGCGIVAAMTLIIEHLRKEQMVDVYRAVVKVLRARQQFITTKEQFHLLYTSTATYLQDYANYGNFQ